MSDNPIPAAASPMASPNHQQAALALLREVLTEYSDVPADQVQPEATLAALQIDSLTAAEMLFALEDRLGVPLADPGVLPTTVADVLALVVPHLSAAGPAAAGLR